MRRNRARSHRVQTRSGSTAARLWREGHRGSQRRESRAAQSRRRPHPMTTAQPARRATVTIAAPVGEGSSDSVMRQKGRAFIVALYSALRSVKLYPPGHSTVNKALDEVTAISREIAATEHGLELRVSGEFMFVNGTRLRLDLDNYASFSHVLSVFRVCGIGQLHVDEVIAPRDWQVFLSLVQVTSDTPPDERLAQLLEKLNAANVA